MSASLIGRRLGKYCILQRLAAGGMAEIYLARAIGAGGVRKLIVIKRVLPHLLKDPEFTPMFLNEARISTSLDHPYIAHVSDVGMHGDEYFLAMEYVHGQNLRRVLAAAAASGGIPMHCALALVSGVAEGLHYAHERTGPDGCPLRIVHRDLSPSNVMVTYDGHAKILDFGVAKAAANTTLTRTGVIKGKIGYMSPEQCVGEELDRRSDIFALGILLYETTLGRRAFFADSDYAVMNLIAKGRLRPPRQVNEHYPPELESLVLRAMAPAPEDRFSTAREFQVALDAFAWGAGFHSVPSAVGSWMLELFGDKPYPNLVELERKAELEGEDQLLVISEAPRPATSRLIIIGVMMGAAVVAGGVGLGLVTLESDNEPAATPAALPIHEGTPEPGPVQVSEELESSGASERPPEVIAPEPVAEDSSPASPRRKASTRRSPRRRKSKAKPSTEPRPLFPPSHYEDG